jgi:hypothetical protein
MESLNKFCTVEDVHPYSEESRKLLKIKLSVTLATAELAFLYPNAGDLRPVLALGPVLKKLVLAGSTRNFELSFSDDTGNILDRTAARLQGCDYGEPMILTFVAPLNNGTQNLPYFLSSMVKEKISVQFDILQGDLFDKPEEE